MFQALLFLLLTLPAMAEERPCTPAEDPEIKAVSGPIAEIEGAIQCGVTVSCADNKPFLAAQEAVGASS